MADAQNLQNETFVIATEEEKKRLLERIMELFKKIFEHGLFKQMNKGFATKLKALEKEIVNSIAESEMTRDAVDDIAATIKKLEGKLDTLTPDKVKELADSIEELKESIARNCVVKGYNPPLAEMAREILEAEGLTVEDGFEDWFKENATVYKENGQNHLLIDTGRGVLMRAEVRIDEDDKGKKFYNINITKDDRDPDELRNENGKLKAEFENLRKSDKLLRDVDTEVLLSSTFSKENNLTFVLSDKEIEAMLDKKLTPEQRFLMKCSEPQKVDKDGLVLPKDSEHFYEEIFWNKEDGTFRTYNPETKILICGKCDKDGDLSYVAYHGVNDVKEDVSGKSSTPIAEFDNTDEGIKAQFHFAKTTEDVVKQFRNSPSLKEFAINNKLSGNLYSQAISTTPFPTNIVSKATNEHRNQIYTMAGYCNQYLKNNNADDRYVAKAVDTENGLCLVISTDNPNSPALSVAFNEKGMPEFVSFKEENSKQFHAMYNILEKNWSYAGQKLKDKSIGESADRNIDFENMFDIMVRGANRTYSDNINVRIINSTLQSGIDAFVMKNGEPVSFMKALEGYQMSSITTDTSHSKVNGELSQKAEKVEIETVLPKENSINETILADSIICLNVYAPAVISETEREIGGIRKGEKNTKYDSVERQNAIDLAERVNQAAFSLVTDIESTGEINIKGFKTELVNKFDMTPKEADEVIGKLRDIEVISKGAFNAKVLVNEDQYSQLVNDLARNYDKREKLIEHGNVDCYAAFLTDSYADSWQAHHSFEGVLSKTNVMESHDFSAVLMAMEANIKEHKGEVYEGGFIPFDTSKCEHYGGCAAGIEKAIVALKENGVIALNGKGEMFVAQHLLGQITEMKQQVSEHREDLINSKGKEGIERI